MKKIFSTLIILISCTNLYAGEMPSSAEAAKVLDFYYHGQGKGVILMETKFCSSIGKTGAEKNECTDDLNNAPTKGEQVNFWMTYLVPKDEKDIKIIIQFEQGGITRMVKNIVLSGSIRFRTWRKIKFSKTGNWAIKIIQEMGDNTKILKEMKINVQAAAPAATIPPTQ